MNTAISDKGIDTRVKPISPAPFSDASNGEAPSSMCRTMFSITTTASSTTKPTAIDNAISDRLSRLYPSSYSTAKVPINDNGTVTAGITVAQKLRRKMKITITTSATVSINVNCTSLIEARIVSVRSEMTLTLTAGGTEA